jgi:putative ABC transport system permease protein
LVYGGGGFFSQPLITRNAVSLIFTLPIAYKDRIRQTDGVKQISGGNFFGGIYKDEKTFFANYAVEPRGYLELYPEIILPPDQKEKFLRDRRACIAGRKLAERYRWKIGDDSLKGTYIMGNWEFVLRGIYHGKYETTDERVFVFHWDYLNEVLKKRRSFFTDQVGFFMIGVKDPNRAAEVAQAVDKNFKNSLAETITETEKAFVLSFISMADAIIIAIQLLVVIVIIVAGGNNGHDRTRTDRRICDLQDAWLSRVAHCWHDIR